MGPDRRLDVDEFERPWRCGLAKKANWNTNARSRQDPDRTVPGVAGNDRRWNRYVSGGE